jgi:hypothetical protein
MIDKFKELERPFLAEPLQHSRRRNWEDDNFGREYESTGPDDIGYECYATQYRRCGIRERYIWLKKKKGVVALLDSVHRVEVRRMAMQMVDLAV